MFHKKTSQAIETFFLYYSKKYNDAAYKHNFYLELIPLYASIFCVKKIAQKDLHYNRGYKTIYRNYILYKSPTFITKLLLILFSKSAPNLSKFAFKKSAFLKTVNPGLMSNHNLLCNLV